MNDKQFACQGIIGNTNHYMVPEHVFGSVKKLCHLGLDNKLNYGRTKQ